MVMALHALLLLRAFPPLSLCLCLRFKTSKHILGPHPFLGKREEGAAYCSENVVDLAVWDTTRHMFGCKSVV